jgi:hypothetical protein
MARVEAMKTALGQAESFTQAASETRTLGQIVQSVGRNLGGIAAAAELLAEVKSTDAPAYEVSQTSMGVLGGLLIGGAVAAIGLSTGTVIFAGIAGALLGKYLWSEYVGPALGWSEGDSPLFWDSFFDGMNIAISNLFGSSQRAVIRRDPLTLDLDGDGLETVPGSAGVLFDHDGDGVATGTGWVASDDGLLVWDRNGNGQIDSGRELFGDSTLKSSGQLAVDGFDALADLDTNADGTVNTSDANYAQLRVWRDLDQDGITDTGELVTLSSLGIAGFNTAKTANNQVLADGNRIADLGTYIKTDGSTATMGDVGQMADIDLTEDTFHRQFADQIPFTEAAHTLRNMQGSGLVRDPQNRVRPAGSCEMKSRPFFGRVFMSYARLPL